jgi:hypothetical protein
LEVQAELITHVGPADGVMLYPIVEEGDQLYRVVIRDDGNLEVEGNELPLFNESHLMLIKSICQTFPPSYVSNILYERSHLLQSLLI